MKKLLLVLKTGVTGVLNGFITMLDIAMGYVIVELGKGYFIAKGDLVALVGTDLFGILAGLIIGYYIMRGLFIVIMKYKKVVAENVKVVSTKNASKTTLKAALKANKAKRRVMRKALKNLERRL